MSFDTTWKLAIEKYCRDFFEFFFGDVALRLDWSCTPEMLNRELQKFAPDSKSGRKHADCLLRMRLLSGEELYVLIHIEVQSQVDPHFAERMATYHWRIRDYYQSQRVCSLAILGDPDPNWRPNFFESTWLGCRIRLDFPVCKLLDLPDWPQNRHNPFGWLVAAHRLAQRHGRNSRRRQEAKFSLVRQLYEELSPEEVREFFNLVDGVLALSANMRYDFWQRLRQFEEERQMVYLNSIERLILEEARKESKAEGRAEGKLEGKVEGRSEGLRLAICKLAQARWGIDFAVKVERVTDLRALEELFERLLVAESAQPWME